jgi:thiol-disulfide isomerase/thioredoxin
MSESKILELDETNADEYIKDAAGISVLLVYVPGCKACDAVKGHYEELAEKHQAITFFKADLNKVLPLYMEYADEDPTTIDAETGKPTKQIVAPMFYMFADDEQSEENPHGHIGGVDGADIPMLYTVLEALSAKTIPCH